MTPEFCAELKATMELIKEDMAEIKIEQRGIVSEQKEIKDYITNQKAQIKAFWWLVGGIGSIALFFKEHILNFFFYGIKSQ